MFLPAINQANTKRATARPSSFPIVGKKQYTGNTIQYAKLKAPATIIYTGIHGFCAQSFLCTAPNVN